MRSDKVKIFLVHLNTERTLIVGHVSQRLDFGLGVPEKKCGIRLVRVRPAGSVNLKTRPAGFGSESRQKPCKHHQAVEGRNAPSVEHIP
jgi:hypothetical protein